MGKAISVLMLFTFIINLFLVHVLINSTGNIESLNTDVLRCPPKSSYGTSSAEYGQVSLTGKVEKTPFQIFIEENKCITWV